MLQQQWETTKRGLQRCHQHPSAADTAAEARHGTGVFRGRYARYEKEAGAEDVRKSWCASQGKEIKTSANTPESAHQLHFSLTLEQRMIIELRCR